MPKRIGSLLLHLAMLAIVCVIAAYWAIRIMTPLPTGSPPPPLAAAPREVDPALAARMFGLLQAAPVQRALNVQVVGVFAAGRDSAAIVAVDGKPPRVVLIDQIVAPGARLVAVRKDGVTIEQGGVRQDIAAPPRQELSMGGPPPRGFTRDGNVLSAPTVAAPAPASGLPQLPPRPAQFMPRTPPVPQPVYPQQQSPESVLQQALPGQGLTQ